MQSIELRVCMYVKKITEASRNQKKNERDKYRHMKKHICSLTTQSLHIY